MGEKRTDKGGNVCFLSPFSLDLCLCRMHFSQDQKTQMGDRSSHKLWRMLSGKSNSWTQRKKKSTFVTALSCWMRPLNRGIKNLSTNSSQVKLFKWWTFCQLVMMNWAHHIPWKMSRQSDRGTKWKISQTNIRQKANFEGFSSLRAVLKGTIDLIVPFSWMKKCLALDLNLSFLFPSSKKITPFVGRQNQCKLILYAFPCE